VRSGGWAATVLPGDRADQVVAALGEPDAIVTIASRETYYYPRGRIWLEGGVVTTTELKAEAAWLAEQDLKREAEAERAARRVREGLALREAKISDPSFRSSPVSRQLDYWGWFRAAYPGVSVDAEYAMAAQALLAEQTAALRRMRYERELADLEARVNQAEHRLERETAQPPLPPAIEVVVNVPVTVVPAPSEEPAREPCYAAPYWLHRGIASVQQVGRRNHDRAVKEIARSGVVLGNRPLDRSPLLRVGRVGQGSSPFRPPLPPSARF